MIRTQEGYEVPANSADFHARADYFSRLYGDDFFFATGYAKPPETTAAPFTVTSDIAFILSDKVAYNPKPPQTNNIDQQAARASFAAHREQHKELFPAYGDIRGKKEDGHGLQLISGGGFMFVNHAFDDAPETKLALFRRTFGQKVLTDANGLVSSPNTAEKEMVEEYSPVLIDADKNYTVLAVKMGRGNTAISDENLIATKKEQEGKILENLALSGHNPARLNYAIAVLDEMPTANNTLVLQDKNGNTIETMSGHVGFEHDNNTWVYRKAGVLTVPNDVAMVLVDGEFERPGDYYSQDKFAAVVAANDALSSTCAFGHGFLKNWPRATTGMQGNIKPTPQLK